MHLPRLSQTISSKSKKVEIWGCVGAEASVYYSSRRNAHPKLRAFSSGGERFPDTEEVTSSNLVTPTKLPRPEPSGSGLFWYVGAMHGDSVSGPILHLVGTSTSGPVLAHSGAVRTSRSSRKVGQMRSGRSRTKGPLYARWPTRHIGWRRRCSLGHCDPPWAPLHSRHTFFCPSWLLSQAENLLWGSDAIPAPDSGGPCLLGGAALFVLTPLALLAPGLRGIGMPATVPQLYTWLSNIGTARLCNNYQHVTVLGLLRAVLCQSRTCRRRRAARFTVPRRG